MNVKWMTVAATMCATAIGLLGMPATARAAVVSGVTVDKATVTAMPNGMFQVAISGTMTLGTTDTFVGIKVTVTDPNNNNYAVYLNAPPPTQGNTSNWNGIYGGAATPGMWSANASMTWTAANGTKGIGSNSLPFKVGP